MAFASAARAKNTAPHEFESVALLLQGGGALGPYQAGVYEALAESEVLPDWIGGISIGAINGAIIAGNRPEMRVAKLRGFWKRLTSAPWGRPGIFAPLVRQGGDAMRRLWDQMSAGLTLTGGVPGFFSPRPLPPWCFPPGSPLAASFYDSGTLRKTLEEFIDFELLNGGAVRYTTSAVDIRSGNYTVFDNRSQEISPLHIMASGALPPGMPPVEIRGQPYWDGGLISNTPLEWVMNHAMDDTLVFQVDLWSARGEMPRDILEVMTRQKEIQYSSRTRAITDQFKHEQKTRHTFAALYEKLPDNLKKTKEAALLHKYADVSVYNIVHLIYRARHYEGYSKDYEFSRLSMEEHWQAGYDDTTRSLSHPEVLKRPTCPEGIKTYDIS
jgi:NTE family protein